MKFLAITLIVHAPDPLTGKQKPTADRFREVVGNAVLAESLGFDGFGVGERHERPFISSSPPVVLSHVAAQDQSTHSNCSSPTSPRACAGTSPTRPGRPHQRTEQPN